MTAKVQEYPQYTVCDLCGRENYDEEEPWPNRYVCPNCEAEEQFQATQHVQEYPGLDAAGLLLVALGHLVKAGERLAEMPKSAGTYRAKWETTLAANHARYALKQLAEEKEETCEKS